MRVLKYGGTSVGTVNQIQKVVNHIKFGDSKIVVFSAFSGVTNLLSEFISQSKTGNWIIAEQLIELIQERHLKMINHLITGENFKSIAHKKLNISIKYLRKFLEKRISVSAEKEILVQGELLSSMVIFLYTLEQGIDAVYIEATRFMKLNRAGEPDFGRIRSRLIKEIDRHNGCKLFITNGFICLDHRNRICHLGRGGSDYSATIIGNVLESEVIEIWTDIDGLQNNDPRYVESAKPIRYLSYDEACELAYFGAKILHPASITPAQKKGIPIHIKNSMSFNDKGTLISSYIHSQKGSAISAKDGITTIKIKSGRMMQAYGFLRRIFEVFEKYKTPVDMLTTSEISVAMTIDNNQYINEIAHDLSGLGEIEIISGQSIICIVGNFENERNILIQKVIDGLEHIPVGMISFGASKINLSLVVDTENKAEALNLIHNQIFQNELCAV